MKSRLRILQVYNKYRTWGGEATVVELEADLLRRNGHEVECLSACTGDLDGAGLRRLVKAGFGTVWSFDGYTKTRNAIERFSPDILHVHNTFPLLSPSVLWAANRSKIPVVHTLHNYRLACANAVLVRNNRPCEDCVGRIPVPAMRYRCFGASFLRTAAVIGMNVTHRWLETYQKKVHAYIALTEFSKEIFVKSGLPRERIFVKSNFCRPREKLVTLRTPTIVFVGAIVGYKGIQLLLDAWSSLGPVGCQLMIVGEGPDRDRLETQYANLANVAWCGVLPREKVIDLVSKSKWLVLPSLAYENFPTAILEAFSAGTPVIVPDHGAFTSIVSSRREGLMFSAGNSAALRQILETAVSLDAATWTGWSNNALDKFSRKYTDVTNYEQLITIYQCASEFRYGLRGRTKQPVMTKAVASAPEV
jgi:glycosyltransferase involved in cell wall biosynthesis